MSETIDDSLDRLANGVDANDRLTLSSILETGLPYMSDEQIGRTRVLCAEVFANHAAKAGAGMVPQARRQHVMDSRRGGSYAGGNTPNVKETGSPGKPDPREFHI